MIFRKLAVSVTRPELQYYFWSIIHVISATIGYFLIRTLGFEGVLIQLFLQNFLMASVPMLTVRHWKRAYFGLYDPGEILKITISLVIGAATIWSITNYWNDYMTYDKLSSLFIGISLAIIALVVFIGSSLLLKVDEIQLIRTKVMHRFKVGNET